MSRKHKIYPGFKVRDYEVLYAEVDKDARGELCDLVRHKCGHIVVYTRAKWMRNATSKKCKCYKHSCKTHGLSRTRAYKSWINMIYRCDNSISKDYKNYGGRSITICETWYSFETFLNDMGQPPENTTLDRIDMHGDYNKENCRWATDQEQGQNTRAVKLSPEKVRQIRRARKKGISVTYLTRKFNVSRSTIYFIAGNRRWANI